MSKKLLAILAAVIIVAGIAWYAIVNTDNSGSGYVLSEATLVDDQASAKLASVQQYRSDFQSALQNGQPVLQLDKPTADQTAALDILLADQGLAELIYNVDGSAYRVEVLQSYALPAGQATGQFADCSQQRCHRLDLYNFTRNSAVVAIINLEKQKLLALQDSPSQPDISAKLTKLATDIANNNALVKKTLDKTGQPLMASTKTSLEKTVCEKSQHLCVAPTYVEADKQRALWVIVDLTDLKIVGTAWTKWDDKPEPVTERQLTSKVVTELCGQVKQAKRGDWAFDYTLTGSDGVEVRNLTYKNRPVIASAKNVDWHVSYSSRDGFGYSDAIGCPEFSTAAVVPSQLPKLSNGPDGQVLFTADFKGEKWPDPCNYYYRQQFQMNTDGSVRVAVANIGRGCGDDGTYRPVTRIALPSAAKDFKQAEAAAIGKEAWWQPTSCEAGQGCPALSYNSGSAYDVIPGNGQFADGGRGDNPFLYLTAASGTKLEGQEDLLTIGPCCNVDYQQGPDKYVDGEVLAGKPAVLWYVAQIENNGEAGNEYCWATGRNNGGSYDISEYPCYSGPLIKPRSP